MEKNKNPNGKKLLIGVVIALVAALVFAVVYLMPSEGGQGYLKLDRQMDKTSSDSSEEPADKFKKPDRSSTGEEETLTIDPAGEMTSPEIGPLVPGSPSNESDSDVDNGTPVFDRNTIMPVESDSSDKNSKEQTVRPSDNSEDDSNELTLQVVEESPADNPEDDPNELTLQVAEESPTLPFDVDLNISRIQISTYENLQPYYYAYYPNPEDNIAESKTSIKFTPEPNITAVWEFFNLEHGSLKKADEPGYFSGINGVFNTSNETDFFKVMYEDFETAYQAKVRITKSNEVITKNVYPGDLKLPRANMQCGFTDGPDSNYVCTTGLMDEAAYPNVDLRSLNCTIQDSFTGQLVQRVDVSGGTMCDFGTVTSTDFIAKEFLTLDIEYNGETITVIYSLDKQEVVI